MKSIRFAVAMAFAWAATIAARADTWTDGAGYRWSYYNGDEISIAGVSPATGDLIVPSEIKGIPVGSIAANAFKNASGLTGVTISEGIKSIGTRALSLLNNNLHTCRHNCDCSQISIVHKCHHCHQYK